MSTLQGLLAEIRQLRFPPELRIEGCSLPNPLVDPEELKALLSELIPPVEWDLPDPPDVADVTDEATERVVRSLCNQLARLEGEVERVSDEEEAQDLRDRVGFIKDTLAEFGVEMPDLVGATYDPGVNWEQVISSDGAIGDPVIFKMQRPRVLFRGEVVQRGIPIVKERSEVNDGD